MTTKHDYFGARALLPGHDNVYYYRLARLAEEGIGHIPRLPFSIRILLETLLRNIDGYLVQADDVAGLAAWNAAKPANDDIAFMPGRVVLQDFTGVPAVVDLAALRSAMARLGGDPARINPRVPVDLVIDHSVQVDTFGSNAALFINAEREFERNRERYEFLKWGKEAFQNFKVVPPASGIVHQVNLEFLAKVVMTRDEPDGSAVAFPDSLVGTDSHTTMINGLGVLGWGVGGIEAEAVMLGQPIYMLTPEVIGFRLTGALPEGATATDMVLMVTEILRARGVVGKFVEFFGPGIARITLPDRATIANMAPEYGATMGFFPVDEETLAYLRRTGRPADLVKLVEAYAHAQGLFYESGTPDPDYTEVLELDLNDVQPSLSGPLRPQDRVPLAEMKQKFQEALRAPINERGFALDEEGLDRTAVVSNGHDVKVGHGAVVIAAITSCTNTSNPSVMLGAGLLAKKAVERGLRVKPYVKTSLAPGSKVVTSYLERSGLLPYLEELGYHVVGYGCTTCIGNSGPLPEPVAKAIQKGDLVATAVLSGNRNFAGRIHPHVRANYLASPPLVLAYALAGTTDIDLLNEPLGEDKAGNPVYLRDIWPSNAEILEAIEHSITPEMFETEYGDIYDMNEMWNAIPTSGGALYEWDPESTYIQEPPFFLDISPEVDPIANISGARVIVKVGDSTTTDHISPAGAIAADSPAGKYLLERGVTRREFNSYGSRRGNDRVMTRGTFANVRLRNLMAPGTEGGWTTYLPTGKVMPIYDAAMKYAEDETPLVVLAGQDYGMGSSRDWAAKGTLLLGIKLVIAESYERIHRSNLIGMGVLPLQFRRDENPATLGLDGTEVYSTLNLDDELKPGQEVQIHAVRQDGSETVFSTICRVDTPVEVEYYRNGGILHTVLLNFLQEPTT
ncbi:MAG: aconitate hydratase AcnA [Anaerolineae bacterium]|nr:aconitate hydratase AcnA [Anaerolineae bacterium]